MYLKFVEAELPENRKQDARKVLAYMFQAHGTLDHLTKAKFSRAIKDSLRRLDLDADWLAAKSVEDQKQFWHMMGVEE